MAGTTIGAAAQAAGVRVDTIRYYERIGMLQPAPRSAAGYRRYTPADIARIRFIRRAQGLGFSLGEISTLLSLRASDTARCADVLRLTNAKIEESFARGEQLMEIKQALERLAAECPGDAPVGDCPILAYLADIDQPLPAKPRGDAGMSPAADSPRQ